jgi:hypothetical protein
MGLIGNEALIHNDLIPQIISALPSIGRHARLHEANVNDMSPGRELTVSMFALPAPLFANEIATIEALIRAAEDRWDRKITFWASTSTNLKETWVYQSPPVATAPAVQAGVSDENKQKVTPLVASAWATQPDDSGKKLGKAVPWLSGVIVLLLLLMAGYYFIPFFVESGRTLNDLSFLPVRLIFVVAVVLFFLVLLYIVVVICVDRIQVAHAERKAHEPTQQAP